MRSPVGIFPRINQWWHSTTFHTRLLGGFVTEELKETLNTHLLNSAVNGAWAGAEAQLEAE